MKILKNFIKTEKYYENPWKCNEYLLKPYENCEKLHESLKKTFDIPIHKFWTVWKSHKNPWQSSTKRWGFSKTLQNLEKAFKNSLRKSFKNLKIVEKSDGKFCHPLKTFEKRWQTFEIVIKIVKNLKKILENQTKLLENLMKKFWKLWESLKIFGNFIIIL